MSVEPCSGPSGAAWEGVRTILVPPDIVAVRRVSPVRVKKRTPWRHRPEGEPIERGGREWFGDQLFVGEHKGHVRAVCSTSMTVHASCMIGLIALLVTQSDQVPLVKVGSPLVMPVMMSLMPVAEAASPGPKPNEPSPPKAVPKPRAADPPEVAREEAPAPPEAPSSIEPETGVEPSAPPIEAGVTGGVPGGAGGGSAGGVMGGAPSGRSSPGPLRVGNGMERPRKIKDAKPIYPQGALSDRARGTVIIDATVGIDGRIQDARVIHSVPLLDQAALDAVWQWEFVPSRLNGVLVAVIITVFVQFAVH